MPTDPQIRATQEVATEIRKLTRVLEMLNSNIVVAINVMRGEPNPGPTITSNPNPAHITYKSGESNGPAQ